jgi:hypothetical protein
MRLLGSIIVLLLFISISIAVATPSNVVSETKKIQDRNIQDLQHSVKAPLNLQHPIIRRPLDLNLTDPIVFNNLSFEKDKLFQGARFDLPKKFIEE